MQILKLVMLTSVFSLVIETANAAPTTNLPQAPVSDSQAKTDAAGNRSASADNAAGSAKAVDKTAPVVATASKDKPSASGTVMPAESDVEDINSLFVQDRLASIVEDDFTFEQARRRLANEVELEKMRSELRKLRGEDKVRPQPVQTQPSETTAKAEPKVIDMPRVVLEAEIGGSRRVAVTDGKTLRYVRTGEIFSMGENKFKLASDKRTVTLVEGATQ